LVLVLIFAVALVFACYAGMTDVEKFSKAFLEKFSRVDYTIFNAGVAFILNNNQTKSKDSYELTFATNHLGHFKLYLDLCHTIESTASKYGVATITHVTSGSSFDATFPPQNGNKIYSSLDQINNVTGISMAQVYARSKLCNILFSNEISRKMNARKINVLSNAVYPGIVNSNFFIETLEIAKSRIPNVLFSIGMIFFNIFREKYMWSAEEGTRTQLYASVSKHIAQNRISGKYFHPVGIVVPPNPLVTQENSEILWKVSLELLHNKSYNTQDKEL